VTAQEAVGWGLVDELADDPLEAAVAYAQELATYSSPNSMAIIKGQVLRDIDRNFAEAVADADRLMVKSLMGADVHEGVESYVEKRPPAFAPLPPRS
jgi:enoyl-CoA hydratase/carnithine racemase